MVHDLRTLDRLNKEAVLSAKGKPHLPTRTPGSLDRDIQNGPWSPAALRKSGTTNFYKTYAASEREPFGKKKGALETIRA